LHIRVNNLTRLREGVGLLAAPELVS
jgi:hypothetical protein